MPALPLALQFPARQNEGRQLPIV